jgi:hypothetical protein
VTTRPESPGRRLARQFHETYERLAPEFGYETRAESAVPWDEVPDNNQSLMVAVCRELLRSGLRAEFVAEVRKIAEAIKADARDEAAGCTPNRELRRVLERQADTTGRTLDRLLVRLEFDLEEL